jgi:hypothetical protein
VADYCPKWWPAATWQVSAASASSSKPERCRRIGRAPAPPHPAPDQRVLPLSGLTALTATDAVFGYSFILTNIDLPWPGTASATVRP